MSNRNLFLFSINMNISRTFIKIWNINIDGNINHYKAIFPVIPEKWQLLLISDGSFTRNLSIINKYTILLKLIKQENKFYPPKTIHSKTNTEYKKKLAFSREIWLIDKKKLFDICQILL
jgi:p-hydroxybenzoic acid synthase